MNILDWPEFQIAHVWILFFIVSIITMIFVILYYLNNIEKRIYIFFLSISKKKNFNIKEMELFLEFYHYYKQKYSLWKRIKEIRNKNILKQRLFEWYFDKLQYDKESTLSFMRILRHLLFKHHLLEIMSINDIEIYEPVVFFINEKRFSLGFVISIQGKHEKRMIINIFKPDILNQNKNKEAVIFFFRPTTGDYKLRVKYKIIKQDIIKVVPISDFEVVSFRFISTEKLFGSIVLKHKRLLFETSEIAFYTEKFSLKGIKIFPSINLKSELLSLLKEQNLNKINWDDYDVKIQITLENRSFSLDGTIKDIYKQEENCYLVLFNFTEEQANIKEIFMNFIKNHDPKIGDL